MDERQAKLVVAKADYRTALRNLESISEEIHAHRRSIAMGTREQGVGAEGDGPDGDVASFPGESDGLSSECRVDAIPPHSSVRFVVAWRVRCEHPRVRPRVCFSGVRVI